LLLLTAAGWVIALRQMDGMFCVGSSVGLMLVLVALGPMSVMWMAVVGGLVLVQKLVPPRAAVDVPLALAIVGLGIATVL